MVDLDNIKEMAARIREGDVLPLLPGASASAFSSDELAWRPRPKAEDGSLLQDPDFSLPTTAGPITWRLIYDSRDAAVQSEWGYGRRGSFPLRLVNDGLTVTVMHEGGSQRQYRYIDGYDSYASVGDNFDRLQKNVDGSWDEIHQDTGGRFHFPAGDYVSISYRETPQGYRLTYNYDSNQRLGNIVEPGGRRITLGYSGNTPTVLYVQDWGNRRNTLFYDAAGNLTQVEGPTACITQYEYDSNHLLTGIADPEGFKTTYSYDVLGRVLTRSVAGNLGRYTYAEDINSVLTMMYEDPLGRIWTHVTSARIQPLVDIDPLGNRVTYWYRNFRPFNVTNPLGETTSYLYDGNGLKRATKDALDFRSTLTRDGYGNVVSMVNALGEITTVSYGANPEYRNPVTVMNALGAIRTYGYTPWGAREFEEDPLGNRTTYVWSGLGLLDAEVNPLGFRRTYLYDLVANRTVEIDPLGHRWSYFHDRMGRVVAGENPLGFRHTTLYDARGGVQAEIDPLGFRTSYLYNASGSRTARIDALGQRSTWLYDAANQLVAQVDALGRRSTSVYDRAGRLVASVEPAGFTRTTVYDAAGRVIESIDPTGIRQTTIFDAAGRAVASLDPLGLRGTTVFDAAGQVVASVRPTGARQSSVYDAAGRQVASEDPFGCRSTTLYPGLCMRLLRERACNSSELERSLKKACRARRGARSPSSVSPGAPNRSPGAGSLPPFVP